LALSHQYARESATLCTLPRFGFALSVRFYDTPRNFRYQCRRASLGKTHHLPISRPTSLRFGSPDIRPRTPTHARPPPRCHIVGSLFATYMGSASCFLQTPHFWKCPCLVGVALPSGNGGLFITSNPSVRSSASAPCQAHVDTHGLTPVALKKEFANLSFGIHPRAHARGPLPILIES
jgi:hypothetical protein